MASEKISQLLEKTTPGAGDLLSIVDVSDTTDASSGTTKKMTKANLFKLNAGAPSLIVAASDSTTNLLGRSDFQCDGVSDDVQINAAIAALPAAGGRIILTDGTFSLSQPIAITSSRVTIEGAGNSTVLFVANNANITAAITIIGTGVTLYSVRNLYINGNNANQTNGDGIYISTTWNNTNHDPNGIFENIYIESVKNNGFEVAISSDTRVLLLTRVRVRGASGNGFYFPQPSSTDCIMDSCIAEVCGLNGFYVGMLNTHFLNCKTFYCGSVGGNNHGFYISGYNNYFENCEAQDNYQSGFYSQNDGDATYGAQGCTFVNCIGDSNGQSGGTTYAVGLQAKNVKHWTIIGGVFMTRPYPSFTQRIGISLEGTTDQTRIIGAQGAGNSTALYSDSSSGTNYPLALDGFNNSQLPGKLVVLGQIRASGGFLQSDPITLTPGTTVATDASTGNTFYLAPVQSFTLSNPSGQADGQTCRWIITQDATGSRILTLDSKFDIGPFTVTLSTVGAKTDIIDAIYKASADKWYITNFQKGY